MSTNLAFLILKSGCYWKIPADFIKFPTIIHPIKIRGSSESKPVGEFDGRK
jgi:hypothetical protein